MRMKKLIGSLIATAMTMGMVSGTSVNAAYKPNPTVVEWDYEKNRVRENPQISETEFSYSLHYSIDTNNIIYVNLNKVTGGFSVVKAKIFSVTTPSNYAISDSKTGTVNAVQNQLSYNKILNGDGTTTWEMYLYTAKSATVVLCPIGTNDTENEITFNGWQGELLNTYTMIDPYESYTKEIAQLKQEYNILYEQFEILATQSTDSIEGDIDGNGVLDARDASMLLTLYARQSVGENITLADLRKELT